MSGPLWFSDFLAWCAQAALLAAAGALLPRVFALRQPRVLLAYWRALLAACLALPLVEPWRSTLTAGAVSISVRPATALGAAPHWHVAVYEVIVAAILAGVLLRLAQVALGLVRLGTYRRSAHPLPGPLEAVAAQVGSQAEFRLSSAVQSPVTFGWIRSVILLPDRFVTLPKPAQRAVACHELLHVRRRDWPQHVLEEFLRAFLWFHPAILWLIARVRLAREQVVDLEVLQLLGARQPYMEALFEMAAGRALAAAVPAPPFLAEHQLAERVALMLKEVSMSKSRLIASLTAMLGCLVAAGMLAAWVFPLKAAPQELRPTGTKQIIQPCPASDPNCPNAGIEGGVRDGISGSITGGVRGGVSVRNDTGSGVVGGVPGGVRGGTIGGVVGGVARGVSGGVIDGVPGPIRMQSDRGSSVEPRPVHTVPPKYPPEAKAAKIEGDVVLNVEIDAEGKVTNLTVESGPEILAKAALDAVRQWEFTKPASAPMNFDVTVHFELAKKAGEEAAATRGAKSTVPASRLKVIKRFDPEYPRDAKAKHIEGEVVLRVTVQKDGAVSNVDVVSGPHELVKSAVDAVRQWQFEHPAKAPVFATVTMTYALRP
jgi:TonB family protein